MKQDQYMLILSTKRFNFITVKCNSDWKITLKRNKNLYQIKKNTDSLVENHNFNSENYLSNFVAVLKNIIPRLFFSKQSTSNHSQ